LVGLAIWLGVHRRSLPRCRRYFAWGWLATAAAILLVSPAAPYSAGNAMTFRAGFVHWDSMRYIALLTILGWLALGFVLAAGAGRQPPGKRIAVFGARWIYPAFGDRHHLHPVRLDRDGRVASLPIADAMDPGDLTVDAPTFRSNLGASAVDLVVVVHLPHPG